MEGHGLTGGCRLTVGVAEVLMKSLQAECLAKAAVGALLTPLSFCQKHLWLLHRWQRTAGVCHCLSWPHFLRVVVKSCRTRPLTC